VGRVRELETLLALDATQGQPGNIALITAPAGMGKTALLEEFALLAQATGPRVAVTRRE
jgi:ATP/maltotriose-dependent transcriptional regulator MalT